jgi:dGTPase
LKIRNILEDKVGADLAAYAIRSADSKGRRFPEDSHELRTDFQRDRDRVIYSTAFRRLEYKTQVFPNHEGDHFRTRLTHTIEVANLSRTLARALNLNEDFSECLALVHDIGHPPFGHCGEEVLASLMKEYGGFEHNEQTFRIVTLLENSYSEYSGLNLTEEVLEAIFQHTKQYRRKYPDSKNALLETQLVSITDEMAYNAHDLEDGLSSGILDESEILELGMMKPLVDNKEFHSVKSQALRKKVLLRFTLNTMVVDFSNISLKNLEQSEFQSPEQARNAEESPLDFSEKVKKDKEELEAFLRDKMYLHPTVRKMMHKSSDFIERLFKHLQKYPEILPQHYQAQIKSEGAERVIADYMSGMTDRYIQEEYIRLFMPFQKML